MRPWRVTFAGMRLLLASLTCLVLTLPVRAQTPVDLELLLAVDASGSVDAEEFRLQLGGIAQAFADPEIQEAIATGPLGRIAVALMIWSDARSKKPISPWMLIDDKASAEGFGDLVMTQLSRRKAFLGKGGTGIGAAIGVLSKGPLRQRQKRQ